MFALAATTRPIKFPRSRCAGMYAFNELFYTIAEKLQAVVLLLTANHSRAQCCKKAVAYCLKHYIRSYGGEVLGSLEAWQKAAVPSQALTHACAHPGSDRATATSPKNRFCPAAPTPAKSSAGLAHPWELSGVFGAAQLAQPHSKPGSSSSPAQEQNNCEQCRVLPSPAEEQSSPRGQALPQPRAKGIRLERSSLVPSPRRRQLLQAELSGMKRALQSSAASPGAIFLVVVEKMRRNDMGNVRNKARSN